MGDCLKDINVVGETSMYLILLPEWKVISIVRSLGLYSTSEMKVDAGENLSSLLVPETFPGSMAICGEYLTTSFLNLCLLNFVQFCFYINVPCGTISSHRVVNHMY